MILLITVVLLPIGKFNEFVLNRFVIPFQSTQRYITVLTCTGWFVCVCVCIYTTFAVSDRFVLYSVTQAFYDSERVELYTTMTDVVVVVVFVAEAINYYDRTTAVATSGVRGAWLIGLRRKISRVINGDNAH